MGNEWLAIVIGWGKFWGKAKWDVSDKDFWLVKKWGMSDPEDAGETPEDDEQEEEITRIDLNKLLWKIKEKIATGETILTEEDIIDLCDECTSESDVKKYDANK